MSLRAFSKNLREIRIHFCRQSPASQGLRDFVVKSYPEMKKSQPGLPILIREASGVESRIIARFDRGLERKVVVDNLSSAEVKEKFADLVSKSQ